VAQADPLNESIAAATALVSTHAKQAPAEVKQLAHGKIIVEVRLFGHEPEPLPSCP
jgi:hypothetical protein